MNDEPRDTNSESEAKTDDLTEIQISNISTEESTPGLTIKITPIQKEKSPVDGEM